jgi:hypothetical protein
MILNQVFGRCRDCSSQGHPIHSLRTDLVHEYSLSPKSKKQNLTIPLILLFVLILTTQNHHVISMTEHLMAVLGQSLSTFSNIREINGFSSFLDPMPSYEIDSDTIKIKGHE